MSKGWKITLALFAVASIVGYVIDFPYFFVIFIVALSLGGHLYAKTVPIKD